MFVVSFRTTRRQLVSMVGCALMVLAVVAVAVVWPSNGAATAVTALPGGADAERIAFLTELGYTVESDGATVREVLIPETADETFTQYNTLQQAAGMDLAPYGGKRVKCWTYRLQAVEDRQDLVANLYVYKEEIIGGDISSLRQGGMCAGLVPIGSLPTATTVTTVTTETTAS